MRCRHALRSRYPPRKRLSCDGRGSHRVPKTFRTPLWSIRTHRGATTGHWTAKAPTAPAVHKPAQIRISIDRFIEPNRWEQGVTLGPTADRTTIIRRLSFDLIESRRDRPRSPRSRTTPSRTPHIPARRTAAGLATITANAGASTGWMHAGYADSNGYFSADTDRPLAYRYRDYVIRAVQRRSAARPDRSRTIGRRRASWPMSWPRCRTARSTSSSPRIFCAMGRMAPAKATAIPMRSALISTPYSKERFRSSARRSWD